VDFSLSISRNIFDRIFEKSLSHTGVMVRDLPDLVPFVRDLGDYPLDGE
jgi:hypothetical protein